MNKELIFGIIYISVASSLSWFQANLQFISRWWHDRPTLTIVLFSLPISFFFFFGWRYLVEFYDHEIWAARFICFAIGILFFSLFSYIFEMQAPNAKSAICIMLSLMIIFIQSYFPDEISKIKEQEITQEE